VFSLDTFDDRRFVMTSGLSLAAIVLATEFGLFQKILHTVNLNLTQWLVSIAAAASVIILAEIRKAVLRRRARADTTTRTPTPTATAPVTASA